MKQQSENFLDFIPNRVIPWEQAEDGHVYLIKEKTRKRWLKKLIDLMHRSQHFHIHLDQLGSDCWLLTDGERAILMICQELRAKYGEGEKQIEARSAKFFVMLRQNGFIQLKKTENSFD